MIAQLSPTALPALPQRARVIDVREPEEFWGHLGHIPGAKLVPLGHLAAAAEPWDRHLPIVAVCRSGARSTRAVELLAAMGFSEVRNLEGGMLAYAAAGLPCSRE